MFRRLKIVYALATMVWLGYSFYMLLAPHIRDHSPMTLGTLFCALLFVSIPAFGYLLLFKLFPLAGRLLKQH